MEARPTGTGLFSRSELAEPDLRMLRVAALDDFDPAADGVEGADRVEAQRVRAGDDVAEAVVRVPAP